MGVNCGKSVQNCLFSFSLSTICVFDFPCSLIFSWLKVYLKKTTAFILLEPWTDFRRLRSDITAVPMLPPTGLSLQGGWRASCTHHLLSVSPSLTEHFEWHMVQRHFSLGGLDHWLDLAVSVCLSEQETPASGQTSTLRHSPWSWCGFAAARPLLRLTK